MMRSGLAHPARHQMIGIRVECVDADVQVPRVVEDSHFGAFGRRFAVDRFLLREGVDHRRRAPRFVSQQPVDLNGTSCAQGLNLVLLAPGG